MWKNQPVLHFCRGQDSVALSSGEAELKATCKGLSEAVGLREAIEFLFDVPVHLRHNTDASACHGILKRRGAGTLKHLSVRQLWTQEVVRRPLTTTAKIPRANNLADSMCSIGNVMSRRKHLCEINLISV